jgi:hypothetical protein
MRRLEVRFHPNHLDEAHYVVVGHVVWAANGTDETPHVETPPELAAGPGPTPCSRHFVIW